MGTQPPPQKGAELPPQFSAHFYCGKTENGWVHQHATWYECRPRLNLADFVLDGDPVPLHKRGRSALPKFSAYVYCGQTAGWIKMPLGTKVGLSPGDSVLDGDPAPSHKGGGAPPQFSAHFYCGQTAGCIKMPLGMEITVNALLWS